MTVRQLIQLLKEHDPESRVYVRLLLGAPNGGAGAEARDRNRIGWIDGPVQERADPYSPLPGPVCIEATAIDRRTTPRPPLP